MGAYNIGKFNLGKYNVKSSKGIAVAGKADIDYSSEVESILVVKTVSSVALSIAYESFAEGQAEKYSYGQVTADITYESYALSTSIVPLTNLFADISYETTATGSLLGEEYIEIKGFVLRPGQEIEINTCELTATINGENAMHLLTPEGDFFDFLPGENDIKISAEGAQNVSIDTYWKDRWL